MYTPVQVSQITKIAPSTLRKYVAQFRTSFSEEAQQQRSRRFSGRDVALVKLIKSLFANGLSFEDIELRLSNRLELLDIDEPMIAEPHSDETIVPITDEIGIDLLPVQTIQQEELERLENLIQAQQAQIETMTIEIKQLRAAIYRAKEDQDRLVRRITELENTSFWGRFSGKGNKSASGR